ncbi:MAG: oligosaccharide flippase family protein [Candidatus Eisenbacteria bacterium]
MSEGSTAAPPAEASGRRAGGAVGSTFRHTAIYSAGAILGRLAGFIMLPVYSRVFGTEGYAVIGMTDAATGLFAVLLSRGFSAALTKHYHREETIAGKGAVLWTGIALVLLQAAVLLPLPFASAGQLSRWLYGTGEYRLVVILSFISLAVNVLGNTASMHLIIHQRSVAFAITNLGRLFLNFTLTILFVLVARMGVVGVFVAGVITDVLWSLVLAVMLLRRYRPAFDRRVARDLIAFQWPLIPGDLVSFASRQAERILLRVLDTLRSVGILEMAYKFPPLIGLLITDPFLLAWRTKSMELGQRSEGKAIIGGMFTNYLFTSVFAGLLLAVNLDTLLHLMTPPEFWPAVMVGRIGIISTILSGCFSYLEFGLLFTRRTRAISLIIGVKALVKLGLSYVFISNWGLQGAALAAALTDSVAVVWVWRQAQRAYPLDMEWRRISAIAVTAVGLFAITLGLDATGAGFAHLLARPIHAATLDLLGAQAGGVVTLERVVALMNMAMDTTIAAAYLLLIPYVRPDFAARLRLGARSWLRRGGR